MIFHSMYVTINDFLIKKHSLNKRKDLLLTMSMITKIRRYEDTLTKQPHYATLFQVNRCRESKFDCTYRVSSQKLLEL